MSFNYMNEPALVITVIITFTIRILLSNIHVCEPKMFKKRLKQLTHLKWKVRKDD